MHVYTSTLTCTVKIELFKIINNLLSVHLGWSGEKNPLFAIFFLVSFLFPFLCVFFEKQIIAVSAWLYGRQITDNTNSSLSPETIEQRKPLPIGIKDSNVKTV